MIPWEPVFDYSTSPTLWRVVHDRTRTRVVIGPVGSGKSTLMCNEILALALQQEPSPRDNIRYVRVPIIRNTYAELKSTTIKTWSDCYPAEMFGEPSGGSPMQHLIVYPPRGSMPGLHLEVQFFPLDRTSDVKKLLSYECSFAWFNELREIPRSLWSVMNQRVGRYPSRKSHGVDCTFAGRLGDSNAAEDGHWLEELQSGPALSVYRQPAALLSVDEYRNKYRSLPDVDGVITASTGEKFVVDPAAENLPNLRPGYYGDSFDGESKAMIRVYAQARRGFVADGKPVVPNYDDIEQARPDLPILPGVPVEIGLDIGGGTLMPAAVMGQHHPQGAHLIHEEVIGDGIGVAAFAPVLMQRFRARYGPDATLKAIWCDPAADTRDEIFETMVTDHLRRLGLPARTVSTNDPNLRVAAINGPCERRIAGVPGLLIDERCKMLRAGLAGRWYFKRLSVTGDERHADTPIKNRYSHPADACGYLMIGGGELAHHHRGSNDDWSGTARTGFSANLQRLAGTAHAG